MDYLKDRSTDEPLEEYWDDTHNSEQYQEHIRRLGYPGTILDKIYLSLTPESTVLDIGAGHGTFCIPIAKKVRSVTAIEPSSGQIAKILKKMNDEKIDNIRIIQKRWEDITDNELETYSFVIAAHCFTMKDISCALQKMINVTSDTLFVISTIDNGNSDNIMKFYDSKYRTGEFFILYNMLSQLGYIPQSEIFQWHFDLLLEEQIDTLRKKYKKDIEIEEQLVEYLTRTNQLFLKDNAGYIRKKHTDGLILCSKRDHM